MRPQSFEQFVGNVGAVEKLQLKISAAKKRGSSFPHFALFGPAGIGKSTLAEITSKELDSGYVYINATSINSPVLFRKQISEASNKAKDQGRAIVMIDECHALPRKVQDSLLSLLEHPAILCTSGYRWDKGKGKIVKDETAILKEKLPEGVSFCLATTHPGNLTDALLSRLFKIELEQYTVEELSTMSKSLIKGLKENLSLFIGENSRTARDVNKICEHITDIVEVDECDINKEVVKRAVSFRGYEMFGCTKNELRYIQYLGEVGQASLVNLFSFLNISKRELEEKLESFLIRKQYIKKESRGRILTPRGRKLYKVIKKELREKNGSADNRQDTEVQKENISS